MHLRHLVLAALFAPAALQAQSQVPAAAPLVVGAPAQPMLLTGTEVPLRLLEELSTKNKQLRSGHRFHLETAEPIMVHGVPIIPIGTPAVGEITEVTNKGMWGKSGRFAARMLFMTAYGRQIRLTGNFDDKGTAGGAAAVAVSALVFLPAGFFMTGTSALVPSGTIIKGFIGEDVPLQLPTAPAIPVSAPVTAIAAGQAAPVIATVPVAAVVGTSSAPLVVGASAVAKRPANTPSGFCYDVPRGYAGTGSLDRPIVTSATPACYNVSG